eukprot:4533445-Prorocentrum_lima.AAC.1
MTSSLVGSEMCIRDRLADAQMRCSLPEGVPRNLLQDLQLEFLQRALSVSYTHLTLPTICSV